MRKQMTGFMAALAFIGLTLVGCENPGGSGGKNSPDDAPEEEKIIYTCKSEMTSARVQACIHDGDRAMRMAADIDTWTVPVGDWLSLLFETKYFQSKYTTNRDETSCLIQQFCKEKAK